jgi:hypothetical protein
MRERKKTHTWLQKKSPSHLSAGAHFVRPPAEARPASSRWTLVAAVAADAAEGLLRSRARAARRCLRARPARSPHDHQRTPTSQYIIRHSLLARRLHRADHCK